ncbi:hypothetical protein JCM10207_007417 [Rhodosporidiobolus poonsookiae]
MADFDFAAFKSRSAVQNEELLNEAGVHDAVKTAVAASSKPASTSSSKGPRAKAASKKRKAEDVVSEGPVRRSMRGATMAASAGTQKEKEEALALAQKQKEEEEEKRKEEERRLKHDDREIEAQTGVTGVSDNDSLREMLKEMAGFSLDDADRVKVEKGKRPAAGTDKLKKATADLDLRAIVKIIPDRIYSMTVHPTPDRDIVFAGDKSGRIALWDCTDAGKSLPAGSNGAIRDCATNGMDEDEEGADADDEEKQQWGKWWIWQGHSSASISALKFRPNNTKQIYSSGYDCTLRSHDFERGISEEIIDCDRWADEGLIHSFDFDPTGNELWVSDHQGGLIFRDLRESKDKAKRWDIDRAKVGCISLNQANPNMAVTAHLKRTMRLWDLSVVRGLPEDTADDDLVEQACVAEYSYDKACSSAYFDATGTRLLSTSYDDNLRIWDIDPNKLSGYPEGQKWKPTKAIKHNCQVGRYVTVLRAHWSSVPSTPPHLFVGDMHRTLDVYSTDGTRVKAFDNEAITAVPAVTAAHPTIAGKYFGGAASGKVSFWTTPLEEE